MDTRKASSQIGVGPARCWAEIRLDRLIANIREIRDFLGPDVRLISVVKADAYGLGAAGVSTALATGSVDFFAVANIAEGNTLKSTLPRHPVLLLSATVPDEDEPAVASGLIPTLSTDHEISRFERLGSKLGRVIPIHLKIDTGMGRLGTWHTAAGPVLRRAIRSPHLRVEGIYTHFPAGAEDPAFTASQRRTLLGLLETEDVNPARLLLHCDNSGGLESFPGAPFNAVRLGLIQLGYPVLPEKTRFQVKPVVSLHSRVTIVKEVPAGSSISYGRSCILRRPSQVAVIGAGYADGVPRACGNKGAVLVRGVRCPILGHVTMDETIVDVTDLGTVEPGDRATFFGDQEGATISLAEFSSWADSIPWESLCRLSGRVERRYIHA